MNDNKEKTWKLNRECIIALCFVLFIFLLPLATGISYAVPQGETTNEGSDILDANGTAAGLEDKEKDETQTSPSVSINEKGELVAVNENKAVFLGFKEAKWFKDTQDAVNGFTDDLFLRKNLITFNTGFSSLITGNTYLESTQVLRGKEDYLFYKTTINGNPIYDYMGINHFTQEELDAIVENMITFRDTLAAKGIRLIVMGIPNKENIYSEYMPDTIPKVNEESRLDQLTAYVQANTDIVFVNPKENLLKEKENIQVYYKTDTHWNQVGAFVGMQTILSEVYGDTYMGPETVEFSYQPDCWSGDLANIGGVSEEYKNVDSIYVFSPYSASSDQFHDESALFIGDSFSGFLSVVGAPYYASSARIDRTEFRMHMIDEYNPDVIIWESVERFIEYFGEKNYLNYE